VHDPHRKISSYGNLGVYVPVDLEPTYHPRIIDAVQEICKSDVFDGQRLMRRLLMAIVVATLDEKPHKESTLAKEVWGEEAEKRVALGDPKVRMSVRRLRSLLAAYYAPLTCPDDFEVRVSIPKGSYAADLDIHYDFFYDIPMPHRYVVALHEWQTKHPDPEIMARRSEYISTGGLSSEEHDRVFSFADRLKTSDKPPQVPRPKRKAKS
jgi:hypothetical protein